MKKINKKELYLDKEEMDILKDVENGKYISVENLQSEILRYGNIAREQLAERKAISIRLPLADIVRLKAVAARDGVPYQTLIGSILHRYTQTSSLQ